MATAATPKRLLTTQGVADRYGIHPKSVKRWWKSGVISPPVTTINGRHYFAEDILDQDDRQRVVETAVAFQKARKAS